MDALETVARQAQECIQRMPVVVLGSGASVPHGIPGMGPLARHLATSTLPSTCSATEHQTAWQNFLNLLTGSDLERALSDANVSAELTQHIIDTSWRYLNSADLEIFNQVITNRQLLPLSRLFRHLFQSTAIDIHVVTPNYDRLAEYAAEAAGYVAFTGFNFGYLGARSGNPVQRIHSGTRRERTVNVWKVHGSFGWFRDGDGSVYSLPPMQEVPVGMSPVIVTPGTDKYRRTHDEPFRSAMQNADDATQKASAFLCIGYGFNDTHLQPRLIERCNTQQVPLVLITKKVSEPAHTYFRSGKCQRYLAIEESTSGIMYYSSDNPDGEELNTDPYWQLDNFLNLIA